MPNVKSTQTTILLLRAAAFAAEKHANQRRKDRARTPYINHPLAVARVLAEEGGVKDPEILAAALLHDTLEDTDTTLRELERAFGKRVASLVVEVTDDKTLPKQVRKQLQIDHAPHKSRAAALIKVADKICNLRDLRSSPPKAWSRERRQRYGEWATAVVSRLLLRRSRLRRVFKREAGDLLACRHIFDTATRARATSVSPIKAKKSPVKRRQIADVAPS
jgi:guanosine-3',5'-bis(diphosphate) 3'-pyrophosphohydrolase